MSFQVLPPFWDQGSYYEGSHIMGNNDNNQQMLVKHTKGKLPGSNRLRCEMPSPAWLGQLPWLITLGELAHPEGDGRSKPVARWRETWGECSRHSKAISLAPACESDSSGIWSFWNQTLQSTSQWIRDTWISSQELFSTCEKLNM